MRNCRSGYDVVCGIGRDLFTVNARLEEDDCCVVPIGDCGRGNQAGPATWGILNIPDMLQYTAMAVNWQEERTDVECLPTGWIHAGFPN